MSGQHKIEVWSFPVLVNGSPVNHRFLVLVDGNGNTVKELHGGAKGPDNEAGVPTFKTTALYGTLLAKEGDPNLRGADGNPLPYKENPIASTGEGLIANGSRKEYEVAVGTQAEMDQRWAAVNKVGEAINDKDMNYLPAPTGVVYDANSNGVVNAAVKAGTDVIYKNEPGFYGTPGSETSPLTPAEIDAARAAAGLPPRTGQEDTILVGTVLNADTGTFQPTYTRINGVTGEAINEEKHIRTATGEYVSERTEYENNPATAGNPLETRTTHDPLDIRAEAYRTFTYDAAGRLDSDQIMNDNGTSSTAAYGDDGLLDSYLFHDAAGRVDSYWVYDDAAKIIYNYFYDDLQRANSYREYNTSYELTREFIFDETGKYDYSRTFTASGLMATLTEYDEAQRVDRHFTMDAQGKADYAYSYNDSGVATSLTDYNASQTVDAYYVYNPDGTYDYEYHYNAQGIETSFSDASEISPLQLLSSFSRNQVYSAAMAIQ